MDILVSDVQHIVAAKFCFFAFVVFGIVAIYRRWTPKQFLLMMGGLCGLAYFFLVRGTMLPFWGLEADEITIAAMFEMFAHGPVWSDFGYADLPPFYPPLFFWIGGLFGKVLNLNGVQIMKLMALLSITLFPVGLYAAQQWVWSKLKVKDAPNIVAWLLGAIAVFVVIDWDAVITKPYELISASLVILWTAALAVSIEQEILSRKHVLMFGITGGVLFLLFYFWFFLAAIGLALFLLSRKEFFGVQKYIQFALIGIIILAISSPFWYPLVNTYATIGSENWQLGFLNQAWLNTHGPFLEFTLRGLLLFGGFIALLWHRGKTYIRILLALFIAGYAWQVMGYTTIFFFDSPLQEAKGFYFWNRIILAFGASYGLSVLWKMFTAWHKATSIQRSVRFIALLLLAPALLFGVFADDEGVRAVRDRSATLDAPTRDLISHVEQQYPFDAQRVFLQSNIPALHAFYPMNDFVYFNMHNSHPAALFSSRLDIVDSMAHASSSQALHDIVTNNIVDPIDVLIFYQTETDFYPLYFHVDNYPDQFREHEIRIPKSLLTPEYFHETYTSDTYIIFEPAEI